MFICEIAIYIYEGERQARLNVSNVSNVPTFHLNVLPKLFWQMFPANLFCLKLGS